MKMKRSLFSRELSRVLKITLIATLASPTAYAQDPTDPWGINSPSKPSDPPPSTPAPSDPNPPPSWPTPPPGPTDPNPPSWPNPSPSPSPGGPWDPGGGGWPPGGGGTGGGGNWPTPTNPNVPTLPTPPRPGNQNNNGGWPGGGTGGWGSGGYGYGSYYCTNYTGSYGTGSGSWGSPGGFGGFGGIGSGYTNPPGTPPPLDPNGRPMIYPACNVPPEYDCPLFENRPHDGLLQALDALSYAMSTTPECQEQASSMQYVQQNAEVIRAAVGNLQQFMDKPDTAYANVGALEQNIDVAIRAATQLGQVFGNNSLMNSRCGREVMSTGKVAIAINDILNGLAPFALMATAINPALGGAAAFAITGGSMATSAIASIVNMIEQGTVDMTNPEHRKAVLKNTCQYTKIARKIRFMQLAQSGQIQQITTELDRQIVAYKARFAQPSSQLQAQINFMNNVEAEAAMVDRQIRKDEFELRALEMQMTESARDNLYTCLIGNELVRRSLRTDIPIFPASVFTNLDLANRMSTGGGGSTTPPGGGFPPGGGTPPWDNSTGFPGSGTGTPAPDYGFPGAGSPPGDSTGIPGESDLQISSVKMLNDISRRRIMALEQQMLSDDQNAILTCADTTRSWVKGMRQALNLTRDIVNRQRQAVETTLSQNPEFASWRVQAQQIRAEEQTVTRVARVMQELAKDTSVIDRSELDQKLMLIKGALFGTKGAWRWGRSPIAEWLEHTLRLHGNRISSFNENIRSLQTAAFQIRMSGQLDFPMMMQMSAREDYKQAISRSQAAFNLETINLEKVPLGSRGHELACQLMETAWLDWSGAIDHLGATEFMCDLIDGYIDNKIENGIVRFCRGEIALDGRQIRNSRIQDAKQTIINKKQYMNPGYATGGSRTYRDWAMLVAQKMNDLQCPLPPVSVMKE